MFNVVISNLHFFSAFKAKMERTSARREEITPSHYFLKLGHAHIPLRLIMEKLDLIDAVQFASTNTQIRKLAIEASKVLQNKNRFGCFNLDLFPDIPVTLHNIETLHRTFPDLWKLKVSLSFVENYFLDKIQIFRQLKKLSVYLHSTDNNVNKGMALIESVTIRAKYFASDLDRIYLLLSQIQGTKTLSIYNGVLDTHTIYLLETRKLNTLKLHNVIIRNCYELIRCIISNKHLLKLKLTCDYHMLAPQCIMIASDIISRLKYLSLELVDFSFTVDRTCRIKYDRLKYLKYLKRLTIYYTVQEKTSNIDYLIKVSTTMSNVKITFIEYFDSSRLITKDRFEQCKRISYCYKNIIETTAKHIEARSLDFEELRLDTNLNLI